MSLKDKYRPLFCSKEFYHKNNSLFKLIKDHISELNQIEQITVWILSLTALRRPQNWFSGFKNPTPLDSQEIKIQDCQKFSIYELFKKIDIPWPTKINTTISLNEFTRTVRVSPLPLIVETALYNFLNQKYDLKILCYEPSPLELLSYQIQGMRVLTFDDYFLNWENTLYGERDPLSFWIHDLIHAEHFFSHNENRKGQIGFYHFIHQIIVNKILDLFMLNGEFNKSFSYLISDMNSHPLHLVKTLKALIDIHEKKIKPDFNAQKIWNEIIDLPIIQNHSEIKNTFELINSENFNDKEAHDITNFFIRLYDHTK